MSDFHKLGARGVQVGIKGEHIVVLAPLSSGRADFLKVCDILIELGIGLDRFKAIRVRPGQAAFYVSLDPRQEPPCGSPSQESPFGMPYQELVHVWLAQSSAVISFGGDRRVYLPRGQSVELCQGLGRFLGRPSPGEALPTTFLALGSPESAPSRIICSAGSHFTIGSGYCPLGWASIKNELFYLVVDDAQDRIYGIRRSTLEHSLREVQRIGASDYWVLFGKVRLPATLKGLVWKLIPGEKGAHKVLATYSTNTPPPDFSSQPGSSYVVLDANGIQTESFFSEDRRPAPVPSSHRPGVKRAGGGTFTSVFRAKGTNSPEAALARASES
ncbi:hypothetical protein KBA73_02840 [Patescibacteria group bacterium]|nr:hypothetical protein [Patescibacteria group bacterium]